MEIEYLEDFLVLADCLNFSEAAARRYSSQPVISRHIKALEKELGGELFLRTTRDVELSDLGRHFRPHAGKIVEDYQSARKSLARFQKRRASSMTLATVRNMQYYNIDGMLSEFHSIHPEILVNVMENEEPELHRLFAEKQINLYTDYFPAGQPTRPDFIPVAKNSVVAILPKSHPLARKDILTLRELKTEPLLLPTHTSRMNQMIVDALNQADPNEPLQVVYEGPSTGGINLVKAGMGISLQPRELAQYHPDDALRIAEVEPEIAYCYGLVCRNSTELSRPEQLVVEYLKKYRLV